jgi:hypothetical protein
MDNGSTNSSTSCFISFDEERSTSDKVDRVIDALEDIIYTFKTRGCPEGKELLREVLIRNHLLGGSSLPATTRERIYNDNTAPAR